jgi:hypothetical protein
VAFGANFQSQEFAVIDSILDLVNLVLVPWVWFAAKALVLHDPSRRQAGLSLRDAEFDR